jgi:hypothetical protein
VAADVTGSEAGPLVPRVETTPQPAPTPEPRRPHRVRFLVIYGVLGLALGAAIAGVVIYAGRAVDSGPAWSSWKPSGGGLGAAKQIVEHVTPNYRLPDGNQLVDVIAKGPAVTANGQNIPIPFIALRGPKGKVDQVLQVNNSDTFTFSLCGLGQSCSIATGKPSVERATLVRREILELALYTFKYVPSVKHIVAFMPPPAGTPPAYAVYLQKDDLKAQLNEPLTRTLSSKVPLPSQITPREQQRIDGITEPRIYKYGLSQTQQGDAVLVLAPLKA